MNATYQSVLTATLAHALLRAASRTKRLVWAHGCGFAVNPESLRTSIECGMLRGLSRVLHEEVKFNIEVLVGAV